MDRAILEQHFAQAVLHAAEAERHIARLKEFIAAGQDTTELRKLLATFEETQRLNLDQIDRLNAELERLSPDRLE